MRINLAKWFGTPTLLFMAMGVPPNGCSDPPTPPPSNPPLPSNPPGGAQGAQCQGSTSSARNGGINNDMSDFGKSTATVSTDAPIRDSSGNGLGLHVCDSGPCVKEFEGLERVSADNTFLYWMRGAATQDPSGQIAEGNIKGKLPQINPALRNCNGTPVTLSGVKGRIKPTYISTHIGYPGVGDSSKCHGYYPYGAPGGDQYTMLVWSLPTALKGGLNRRVLNAGQEFEITTAEQPKLDAFVMTKDGDPCGTDPVGWLKWMYIKVVQNGEDVYGWAVEESFVNGEEVKTHWTPCGEFGQECCDNNACSQGLACQSGMCESQPQPTSCGGQGLACCQGQCDPGLACQSGICVPPPQPPPCGNVNLNCCPGGLCNPGLVCEGATCTQPVPPPPPPCGHKDDICCAGNTCTDANTACQGNTCVEVHHCAIRCKDCALFDFPMNMTQSECQNEFTVCANHGKVCRTKWGTTIVTGAQNNCCP
jgi:hypothetical protein